MINLKRTLLIQLMNFIIFLFQPLRLFKRNNPNKIILLIDLGHFGDQLMLTPSIKNLRENQSTKNYKIYSITSKLGFNGLKNNKSVDKIFCTDEEYNSKKSLKKTYLHFYNLFSLIRDINPEICFSMRSTFYHIEVLAMYFARVPKKIGYSTKGLKFALDESINTIANNHRVYQNYNLIKLILSNSNTNFLPIPIYNYNPNNVKINSSLNMDKNFVLINPYAEHKYIFDLDIYLESIEYLLNKNFQVVFIGLDRNHEKVQSFLIKKKLAQKVHNFLGKTTLDDLGHLVNNCYLLLTVDTGVRHIANSFSKKVISLRKTHNYDFEFGKYLENDFVINEYINRETYASKNDSINTINSNEVLKVLKRGLN